MLEKCGFEITEVIKDSLEIDGKMYNDVIMKVHKKG